MCMAGDQSVLMNFNQNNSSDMSQVVQYSDQECKRQLMDREELLTYLSSQFTSATSTVSPATREEVLESALKEQNVVIDLLQQMNASLEKRNEMLEEKVTEQSREILEAEGHNLAAEQAPASKVTKDDKGSISFAAMTGVEKILAQKDSIIASLQAKLASRGGATENAQGTALGVQLSHLRSRVEQERLHCIELEEELVEKRKEITKLNHLLSGEKSRLIKSQSQANFLNHELESAKKLNNQQKQLVFDLRASLNDKNLHLNKLISTLADERKKVTFANKNKFTQTDTLVDSPASSPSVIQKKLSHLAMGLAPKVRAPLFEQLADRQVITCELERREDSPELGFSFSTLDIPVSSIGGSCLVIRAVKNDSVASQFLKPGDEILEVNGFPCRSFFQGQAIDSLQQKTGNLKLVIARELSSPQSSNTRLNTTISGTSIGATSVEVKLHSTEDDSEYSSRPPSMVWLTAEDDTDANSSYSGPLYTDSSSAKSPFMTLSRSPRVAAASHTKSPSSETFSTASLLDDTISAELEKLRFSLQQKDEVIDKLNSSLEDHEVSIKHLTTDANELQLKLDESIAVKDNLRNELSSVNSFLTKVKLELEQEREVTVNQAQQLKELQDKIEEYKLVQSQMNDIIEAKESTLSLAKVENEQVVEQLNNLQQIHNSYITKSEKLITDERMQKSEMEKQINGAGIKNEELVLKVTSLSKDLVDAKIKMEQKESGFFERLNKLVTENQNLRTDIASMQEASTKSSATLQNMCGELEELNKELSSKNALLLEQRQLCDTVMKERNQLEGTLGIITAQLQQVQVSKEEILKEDDILKKAQEQWRVEQSELLEACSSRDDQIAQLMQNKIQSSSQLEEANTKISALQREMKQLQDTVDNYKSEKAHLETQILQYKDQLSTLESTSEATSGELKVLNEKLNSSTEQLNIANAALIQFQAKNKTLDEREKKLNEQLDKLSSEHKSSEMKLSMKVRSLEAQKAVIEKELERQNSLHQQGVNDEVTRLRNETAEQRETLLNKESERIKLLTEIDQANKSQQRMQKEIETLKSEREALEVTNNLFKTKHAEMDDILSQSRSNCASLQNKLISHEAANAELQGSNTKLQDRVKELEDEYSKMQDTLQKHEQKIFEDQVLLSNLSQQLETARLEVATKTSKHSKIEEEVKSEKNKVKQLDSSNKLLQLEVEKLSKLRHQLNENIATSEARLDQEKSKVNHLENTLAKRNAEFTAIEETWTAFKKDSTLKIQALTTHNAALEENAEILKKQIDEQNGEHSLITSELTSKLEEKTAALKKLQEEVTAITVESQEKHSNMIRLQHELQKAEKTSSQLKESLKAIEVTLANSQESEKQINSQLNLLQKDHSMLLNINAELKHKVDKSESESISSKMTAKSMSNSMQEIKSNMLAMEERCHILEKQKNEFQKQCYILSASSKELESSNSSVKGELEAYQLENDQMKTTITQMRNDIEKLSKDWKASLEKEDASKTKISQLEAAKKELIATNEALQACQDEMKELLLKAEQDKEKEAELHVQQLSLLQHKLQQREKAETELTGKLSIMERRKQELQSTVDQLIAAQTALNNTLTSSGSAKEMEIAKLQAKLVDLEQSLSSTKTELNQSKEVEAKLKHDISQVERERLAHSISADKLQASVEKMNEEHEEELKKLLEKVKSLQFTNNELEGENQKLKFESSSLNEEINKLANLKLLLAEKEEESTMVNKELKENLALVSALTVERDHLLTTLRRYEVNKHTESVQQPTPKAARASSKEDLIKLLKDKEEEAFRLKDYISKLLASVVERAPFVLEQMK